MLRGANDRPSQQCGYYARSGFYVEKVKHPTWAEAWQHAYEITLYRGFRFQPYTCAQCGYWHVGAAKPNKAMMYELGPRAWHCLREEANEGVELVLNQRFRRILRSREGMVRGSA